MAAVVVAFISWMRLNFDISTGHEIPHTVDSYTKDWGDFHLNLAAFFPGKHKTFKLFPPPYEYKDTLITPTFKVVFCDAYFFERNRDVYHVPLFVCKLINSLSF